MGELRLRLQALPKSSTSASYSTISDSDVMIASVVALALAHVLPHARAPQLRTGSCVMRRAPPVTMAAPLSELLDRRDDQRLVFVGGKGGVGKTSTSSAMAVRFADEGLSTLLVSTDPAHSVSDALAQDLSGGAAVPVSGCENLEVMEVQTDAAVARFREAVGGFRAADLGLGGVAEEALSQLGLDEFADILDNTPPGLDELLSLAEVLELVRNDAGAGGYRRIVFDTAPTGHTLRLLAFPEFLDNLLGKVLALKARFSGAIKLLSGVLQLNIDPEAKLDVAVEKLQKWQDRVAELQRLLTDPDATDFVVVGIPSRLAVAESARLLSALVEQDVPVSHLVVNQIIDEEKGSAAYLSRLAAEQQKELQRLDGGGSALGQLLLSRVPFFETELRGVFPLKYLATVAFGGENADAWSPLLDASDEKFVLVGGKGGVGKTSTSAALALECAERGAATLVVSTDPAHSLGDALDVDLSDGEVKRVEGVTGASLYAVEVNVDDAVQDFKRLVGRLADGGGGGGGGGDGQIGIGDFTDVFDAVPPGVDELVALAKVVSLARRDEYGVHFDRVVVDTAPTGHTLRLLSFPEFLDRFITRLLALRGRLGGAAAALGGAASVIGGIFNKATGKSGGGFGGAGGADDLSEPAAVTALKDFQEQMRDLDRLLVDNDACEFVVVSIPTALSINESERLLAALKERKIAARRGVLNRLVSADAEEAYLARMAKGQGVCLGELSDLATRSDVSVTRVPFFDTEVRSVYGLRAMSAALFD